MRINEISPISIIKNKNKQPQEQLGKKNKDKKVDFRRELENSTKKLQDEARINRFRFEDEWER